ncbi:hypothetical protein D3OALGA1CA_5890 [Olavius algarvensis associated proteobacterium Delta 3]|nr:hypothetical protein D3OALGA1CA_5890 [Olavius algarvensis associated proteobacterium Delta 3]
MSGTGKVFRMATVNAEKPQIDMRYSNADGMWYPSQPAPLASGSDAVFVNKDSESTERSGPHGVERNVFTIICDSDQNPFSSHVKGSARCRKYNISRPPLILILEVGSVQDQSGDHAQVVCSPEPPGDSYDPLAVGRSAPNE